MIQDLYPDEARYLSKIAIFFVHPCIRRPPYESPRRNIAMPFGAQTLEWCGYPMAKKLEDMWNRFDRMSACDIQTDGRTDGHLATAYSALCIGSRGKHERTEFAANWHRYSTQQRHETINVWGQISRSHNGGLSGIIVDPFGRAGFKCWHKGD